MGERRGAFDPYIVTLHNNLELCIPIYAILVSPQVSLQSLSLASPINKVSLKGYAKMLTFTLLKKNEAEDCHHCKTELCFITRLKKTLHCSLVLKQSYNSILLLRTCDTRQKFYLMQYLKLSTVLMDQQQDTLQLLCGLCTPVKGT